MGICFNASPQPTGSSSGNTKNHRNICTSKGILRNNSTYAFPKRTNQGLGVVRQTPTTVPSKRAMVHAQTAVASVHHKPDNRVVKNVPEPSGLSAQKMLQFHL